MMTDQDKRSMAAWVRACKAAFLAAPTTRGRTGRVFSGQVDDPASFEQARERLKEAPCGKLGTSQQLPGALWYDAEAVEKESGYTSFSQTLYAEAVCHRAMKGIFQDSRDGRLCLKLLPHFRSPALPPPPVPPEEWGF